MTDRSGIAAEHAIQLQVVDFEGHRFVAFADLGLARAVPLMVHGNARVYLSLVHDVAEQLLGGPVPRLEDYGYTARGKGTIDVATMRLGGAVFNDNADVSVFDLTGEPDAPVQGILGTRFLLAARAAVDFTADSLLLGVDARHGPRPELVQRGYGAAPMLAAEDGRVTIEAYFPAIGRILAITPSAVANELTLHRPSFAGRLPMQEWPADRSPSGTSPAVFTGEGIDFQIAGVGCRAEPLFENLAEYASVTEDDLSSFGMLGFDWMRRHRAILDYANLVLYFQP